MEYSSEEHSSEERSSSLRGANPTNVGFALVAAFAIGLALGFFGRPQIIDDIPIQVVVTVVSDNSAEAVTQAPASNSDSINNSNSSHSSSSMSEADSAAATEPEQAVDAGSSASAQATPTIMDFVMTDARHIQGNMDAPVTIIEFSDFK